MPPAWSGLKAAEGSAWSRSARRRAEGASVSAGYHVPLMCPPRDEGRPVCWGVLGAPPCAHPPVSGSLSPWPPERAPLPPSVRLAQGHHHLHTCLPPGTSRTVVSPPGHLGERAASRPSASRKPPHSSCRWRRQACPQVPCPHVPPPGPLWEPGRVGDKPPGHLSWRLGHWTQSTPLRDVTGDQQPSLRPPLSSWSPRQGHTGPSKAASS